MARDKEIRILEQAEVIDAGSEGMAVCRVDNRVVFVPYVVPGDIIDIRIVKKKRKYLEGRAVHFHQYSSKRTEARCSHFGVCGGCRWQNMRYEEQLFYKQKQVYDSLKRIGGIESPDVRPILGSENVFCYRNKLEYTFSNLRWFTEKKSDVIEDPNALGFHIPGMFDKVLDIEKCLLQDDFTNTVRLKVKAWALENHLEFYDIRTHGGFLRNLIIRNTLDGQWMVIVVFALNLKKEIREMMQHIHTWFPQITSLSYIVNEKLNDTISDQKVIPFHGEMFITESINGINFRISPVSFFQTNTIQAARLYNIAIGFAGFKGDEIVYDLYSGTGTISLLASGKVKKVLGIEYVDAAIADARINAAVNGIVNTEFFSGDICKVLDDEFILRNNRPDVIITDPPRAGMHPSVVERIVKSAPEKIVYISCNPATQARDIAMMKDIYRISAVQPVDMFPHTQHVENVILLEKA